MGRKERKIRGIEEVFVHSITSSDYSPQYFILSRMIFAVISNRLTTSSLCTAYRHISICLALSLLALLNFDLCCPALSFSVFFNRALLFFCAI
jgi:hypothetical protein